MKIKHLLIKASPYKPKFEAPPPLHIGPNRNSTGRPTTCMALSVYTKLQNKISLLGESAPVKHGVAFFVGLMDNLGPIANHADIVFDGIVTNVGGGYDIQTGRFNAPHNGTYQFNIVVAAQGRQRVSIVSVSGHIGLILAVYVTRPRPI